VIGLRLGLGDAKLGVRIVVQSHPERGEQLVGRLARRKDEKQPAEPPLVFFVAARQGGAGFRARILHAVLLLARPFGARATARVGRRAADAWMVRERLAKITRPEIPPHDITRCLQRFERTKRPRRQHAFDPARRSAAK
jgi:hypothetical protein